MVSHSCEMSNSAPSPRHSSALTNAVLAPNLKGPPFVRARLRPKRCTAILSVEEPSHATVPSRFQGNKADIPRDLRARPGNTAIKLHSCLNPKFCQEALVGCQNSCTAILSVVEKIADSEVRYSFIDGKSS